ncbi:MAG TPA: hypothetical protein VE153_17490 [Myxococcus sp.]|nr:hypothetical protein [Myxococcus sp.]
MMPPWCTSTSETVWAFVLGVGSTYLHVSPRSALMATPQPVPTTTRLESALMPKAEGSSRSTGLAQKSSGGRALAGWNQVAPPSRLTLMPARLFTRPS